MRLKLLTTSLMTALLLSACNSNTSTANKSTTGATANTTTPAITEQSSEVQKAGYTVGYDMGRNLREITDDIDLDALQLGLKDAFVKKEGALTEAQMQEVMRVYMARKESEMQQKLQEKAKVNKEIGATFLAENAKKEGVKTTPSGLQYKVITEGSGTPPKAHDTVVVNYEGKLLDGTVFDSSYERGMPVELPLDGVIPGWTEGLQLMKPGAKYELYIPAELAYGETGNPSIEPNSTLIFTVELLTKEEADIARQKMAAEEAKQMQEMLSQMGKQQAQATTQQAATPNASQPATVSP